MDEKPYVLTITKMSKHVVCTFTVNPASLDVGRLTGLNRLCICKVEFTIQHWKTFSLEALKLSLVSEISSEALRHLKRTIIQKLDL